MLACFTLSCSIGLISAAAVAADTPKPPKPDPAKPVNYIEWINQTMGAGLKENAATVYRQAYDKFVPFEGDLGNVTSGPWSNNPKVSKWLTANRDALKLFRQAAAMRECCFPLDEPASKGDPRLDNMLTSVLLPNLQPHRQLCRALIAEGYQAWQKGDRKTLIANAVTVIRSGQHLDNTAILIQRLVSVSVQVMGYNALREALKLSEKPDKAAQDMVVYLRQVNAARALFSQALLGERLSTWDWCQRLFVPGTKPETWSLYEPLSSGALSGELKEIMGDEYEQFSRDLKKLPAIGFDATLREVNVCHDQIEQWSAKPYAAPAGQAERINSKIKKNSNPIVRTFVTDLTRACILDARADAAGRAARLIALMLANYGTTGNYPASLDELKSPSLKQIRTDPFSGRDFVYKKQAASFTLYSVGENFKDDGGRHDESWKTGDFVFWPVQPKPPAKAGK
jgi:hypothetical protein